MVSQIIRKNIVSTGGVYRYGGDEFVVLLVDIDYDMIHEIAEKIKRSIEHRKLENEASEDKILTVSQGYVILEQIKDSDIWQVLPYADRQLYMIKKDGKHGYRITHEKI